MRLFCGSQGGTYPSRACLQKSSTPLFFDGTSERETDNLAGDRCWTLAHRHSYKPKTFSDSNELFYINATAMATAHKQATGKQKRLS
jgi:hypothetical protein